MSEDPDALELLYNLQHWGTRSNILVRLRGLGDRPETDLPISAQLQNVVHTASVAIKEINRLRSELVDAQHRLAVVERREPDPEIKRLRDRLDACNRMITKIDSIIQGEDDE